MATYSITEDPKWEWVKLITINTNRDIDISSEGKDANKTLSK